MPTTKQLVYLKSRSGVFKLRDDIKSYWTDNRTGQLAVVFNKGENILHYNPGNFDIAILKKRLEPPFRVTRCSDGEVFFNVLGVNYFEGRFNRAYRVIYENGSAKNYDANYVIIDEHIDDFRSLNVLDYLKQIAQYNVIPVDEEKTISLADKYDKMDFVAKNSLMEAYLNPKSHHSNPRKIQPPVFPFGCNGSQYSAVRRALENDISIIQGPPGTGKTQTILNIMANLLIEGKTMQIVSNNNSAVENVREKMISNGLDFLCAQLGRSDNKKAFVENQSGAYPDMSGWEEKSLSSLQKEAWALSRELKDLFSKKEELAKASCSLQEYRLQLSRIPNASDDPVRGEKMSADALLRLMRKCNSDLELKHRLKLFTKIHLKLCRLPIDNTVTDKLGYLFLKAKVQSLEDKCRLLDSVVQGIDRKNQQLQDISMRILKGHLFKRFCKDVTRITFSLDEIQLRTRAFLNDYPVVLSTTFSATSNIKRDYKFDYLIMDEASQVDVAAGALALSCARNAVIVGDLKQLPNVVVEKIEETSNAVFMHYGIEEGYRFSSNSFLSSLCKLLPDVPSTLLREHYRCHPLIIGFCSKQFYDGELIPMKTEDSDYAPVCVVRTVKGNHARGSVNLRQVDVILNEVLPSLEERFDDIGIIAPYNKQVDALNHALKEKGDSSVAATVHKFQGRENDAIVLSTVDNQIKEFTDDPHLLNVAVSRAKKQFTLVVSADEQPDSNIGSLIGYIEYYGYSVQSRIHSVFDLLYEDYSKERLDYLNKHRRRVSGYDSEVIMYWTIIEALKKKHLTHYRVLLHYPLRQLISTSSQLTPEECVYANRSWTHLDFLVYNTVTHKAVLAIEVDGTRYHKANSSQGQRDSLKDSILESIHLPLLRLSTAGSGEVEKLSQALDSVVC